MSDDTKRLLRQYRNPGVIIDTNILMMYIVGLLDPRIIPTFNRTKDYAIEDFYTLRAMLRQVRKMVTTPNIITEVSNLLGQLPDHQRLICFDRLSARIELLDEQYLPSKQIAVMSEFRRFGVTDAGLVSLAERHLIVTHDLRLWNYLASAGVIALNFNHIRVLNWR